MRCARETRTKHGTESTDVEHRVEPSGIDGGQWHRLLGQLIQVGKRCGVTGCWVARRRAAFGGGDHKVKSYHNICPGGG